MGHRAQIWHQALGALFLEEALTSASVGSNSFVSFFRREALAFACFFEEKYSSAKINHWPVTWMKTTRSCGDCIYNC